MALDRSFVERNRATTERIRRMAEELSDDQLQTGGEHPAEADATLGQ